MPTHLTLHPSSLRLDQVGRHGVSGITTTASDEILHILSLGRGSKGRGGGGGGGGGDSGGRGGASGGVLVVVQEVGEGGGEGEKAKAGEGGACGGG